MSQTWKSKQLKLFDKKEEILMSAEVALSTAKLRY